MLNIVADSRIQMADGGPMMLKQRPRTLSIVAKIYCEYELSPPFTLPNTEWQALCCAN
jgi:hypothetical protein